MDGDAAIFHRQCARIAKQRGGWHRYAVGAAGEAHPVVDTRRGYRQPRVTMARPVAMHTQHRKASNAPARKPPSPPPAAASPEARVQTHWPAPGPAGTDGVRNATPAQIEQAREAHHNIQPQAKPRESAQEWPRSSRYFVAKRTMAGPTSGGIIQRSRDGSRRPDVHRHPAPSKLDVKAFPLWLCNSRLSGACRHHHRHRIATRAGAKIKPLRFEHHADDRAKDEY